MNRGLARLSKSVRLDSARLCKYSTTTTTTTTTTTSEGAATPISINQAPAAEVQNQEKTKTSRTSLYSNFHKMRTTADAEKPMTFAKMLRHSKFVGLGNQKRVRLFGKIVETVGNDLYIDYGGKFYCVCERPEEKGEFYMRGVNVLIELKEFEMSSYFLSAARDLTLLESNARLLGLTGGFISNLTQDEIKELNMEPYY